MKTKSNTSDRGYRKKITYKDSIIEIISDIPVSSEIESYIIRKRQEIERYITVNPGFMVALEPVEFDDSAPEIVKEMFRASEATDTGPMAAVAGVIAEFSAKKLIELGASWGVVENGGDIYLFGEREFRVGIFAGDSPLSNKIQCVMDPGTGGYSVCTSSGNVGHSISFGKADSVTVFSKSAPLSDCAATSIGNYVVGEDITKSINGGIERAKEITDIDGVLIIRGDLVGTYGRLPELISV